MNKYVIDANILIFFHIFTPGQYHRNFWDELERQVSKGAIVILEEIANECKNPFLRTWLGSLKQKGLITKVSSDIQQRAVRLNAKHKIITTSPTGRIKSQADTYLLAYAQKHNLAVFTHEQSQRDPQKPKRIPDVCSAEQIVCERFPEPVMKSLGFASCS